MGLLPSLSCSQLAPHQLCSSQGLEKRSGVLRAACDWGLPSDLGKRPRPASRRAPEFAGAAKLA